MTLFLEIIGTVAFAISGAAVGIQKKMDIFGVAILAMTTAVGGGIIRDIILNITPPAAFREPVYAVVSIATGIVVFIYAGRRMGKAMPAPENTGKNPIIPKTKLYETALLVMDSIGLGIFTVSGMQVAYAAVPEANAFLTVFVGVVTGVGGGVIRDIMAGDMPYIFIKHFYASASLIGAVLFVFLRGIFGEIAGMLLCAGLIIVLRLLAAHFRWDLPRVK